MRSRIRGGDAARTAVATTERLPVPLQATDLVGPFQPMPEVTRYKKPPRGMHGGADGSGAPKGERNGNYKHGRNTKEVAATRRWLREAIHTLNELNKSP